MPEGKIPVERKKKSLFERIVDFFDGYVSVYTRNTEQEQEREAGMRAIIEQTRLAEEELARQHMAREFIEANRADRVRPIPNDQLDPALTVIDEPQFPDVFMSSFMTTSFIPPQTMRTSSRAGVPIFSGTKIIFGVVEKKCPLSGWPSDKVRLVFRPDEFVVAFCKMKNGIRKYHVEEVDGVWRPGPEIARNERPEVVPVVKKRRVLGGGKADA